MKRAESLSGCAGARLPFKIGFERAFASASAVNPGEETLMFSHIMVGTNDLAKSKVFYD